MPTQIVMDHTGDTRHAFDVKNEAEVKDAMARFNELVNEKKMIPTKPVGGGVFQKAGQTFDPTEETIVFRRQMQGG